MTQRKRSLYRLYNSIPTLDWIRKIFRWSHPRVRYPVLGAYVIGSMARGDYKPESDLDIGVIIPPVRGKSSLHVSEYYHRRFSSDSEKPHFGGRVVDFQFFYPGEIEYLIVHNGYTTIKVE